MKGHRYWFTLLGVLLLLAAAAPARADGIIIPEPPWPPGPVPEPIWLTIRYHRVTVTIDNQVATTSVDQVFVNEHDWEAEGTYIFPLPPGATISRFVMWVDGKPVEAQVLPADQARAIYEEIVRKRRDPALLEYIGRDVVQARIFPIPPGGERRIQLEYTQVLPLENGMVRYVYPLNTERFSARSIQEVSIRVDIRSPVPLKAIYSPTHQDQVYIGRDGDHRATVGYEETNIRPDRDFQLVYTVGQQEVGMSLLSYRQPPDDGFFLLLVAPPLVAERVQPKDVLLVLDVSGSMKGEKLQQAKEALEYVLDHLNPQDRFNVIAFSTGVRSYARGLQPPSEAPGAREWVRNLQAIGGTDIHSALLEALAQADWERPTVLIFLTDGQPTEGVVEINQILDAVERAAPSNVRLFPFGVGDDVNTVLLDTLAQKHRGSPAYVRPGERIDEAVAAFYARVQAPVLTDISVDFGNVIAEDIYPRPLPDLFAGTQLILVGRYRGNGPVRVRLVGETEGEGQEFIYEGTLRAEGGDEFIPRLWAARKIGYLLTQIRLYGERKEWVDAVIDLSVRYGIITPYTSFLIQEDVFTEAGREEAAEQLKALPVAPAAGAPAVEMSQEQRQLREAGGIGGAPMPQEAAQVVRHVGSKTFFLREGVWTDAEFDPERMTPVRVQFGSDAYFDLLAARPEWGPYLALGERVVFVAEGAAYEVVEEETGPVLIPPTHTPIPAAAPTPGVLTSPPPTPTPQPPPPGRLCPGIGALLLAAGVLRWKVLR
ncbi:MAG: VIT domain-containing protein [Anaerolineae bacterium]